MRTPRLVHLARVVAVGAVVAIVVRLRPQRAVVQRRWRHHRRRRLGGSDVLNIATTTDVVNLNPMLGNSRTDSWVTDLMYPRLLSINADGSKQPYLATKWGYSADGKTGFFEIRDDFQWSDGQKLTASDVAYTINTIKTQNPKGGVVNGFMTNLDKATAVSPTRVELALKQPDSIVIPEVGFWMTVVPEHVFSKYPKMDDFPNNSRLGQRRPLQADVDRQGPELHPGAGHPLPHGPRRHARPSPRSSSRSTRTSTPRSSRCKKGDVDVIANALPPAQVANLKSTDGITVAEVPGLGFTHMTYNMTRKPMDNPLVRQALAHAVDYSSIRSVAVQGQAVTANNSPITDSLKQFANPSLKEYVFDTEKSQAAARAGRGQQPLADDDLLAAGPGHRGVGDAGQGERGAGRHHHQPPGPRPQHLPRQDQRG